MPGVGRPWFECAVCYGRCRHLGDPWADTTTPHGRLMLTVLSGIAAFELDLIQQRTNEAWPRARSSAAGRS
jgi:hypothetical protein